MHGSNGYVSPDEIFSEVTMMIGDEPAKELSYGFYMGSMQKALSELAFDTYFDQRAWSTPITDLTLEMPNGLWNIEQVFVFNGDDCSASNMANVYQARGFTRYAKGTFKEQRGIMRDPLMESTTYHAGSLLFYNTLSPYIMLSDACAGYQNLMLRYRGMGCVIGEAPIIPAYLRQAVTDYCVFTALKVLKARGIAVAAGLLQDVKRDLYAGNGPMDPGSWLAAKRRVQTVDIKAKNDYAKYMSHLSLNLI